MKDLNITVSNETKEVVLRTGEANPIHIPTGITLKGFTIDAVREYLQKDGIVEDEIKNSYVISSLEKRQLQLHYAARIEKPDTIEGVLHLHSDLEKFAINSGKQYSTHNLAQFIRMNKHYFETKDIALKLVNDLQNFKAKVDREIEASDDKKANVKISLVQKVVSNIPTEFTLLLPIFVGGPKSAIKVEIDIDAQDLTCSLISPELKEFIDNEAEALIENELKAIRQLFPELRIFKY